MSFALMLIDHKVPLSHHPSFSLFPSQVKKQRLLFRFRLWCDTYMSVQEDAKETKEAMEAKELHDLMLSWLKDIESVEFEKVGCPTLKHLIITIIDS